MLDEQRKRIPRNAEDTKRDNTEKKKNVSTHNASANWTPIHTHKHAHARIRTHTKRADSEREGGRREWEKTINTAKQKKLNYTNVLSIEKHWNVEKSEWQHHYGNCLALWFCLFSWQFSFVHCCCHFAVCFPLQLYSERARTLAHRHIHIFPLQLSFKLFRRRRCFDQFSKMFDIKIGQLVDGVFHAMSLPLMAGISV